MSKDLISREALKEDIDFEHICNCCNNHCGNVCDDCSISEIEKKIDNAKTIIWCNQTSDGVPMMDLRGTQKGDLISRSALKKIWELYEKYQPSLAINVYEFGIALKGIIDNTPTVEPICPYLSDGEVKQPCIQAPCERPKGEWEDSHIYSCGKILKGRNDVIEHKCSVCKRWSIKWDGTIPDNYCSHCGADMRGDNNG